MSADKKRKNSATKKKEMAADTEMTANSAAACNVLIDSCHDYYGPEEKMEFSMLSVEDFPSLPSTPLKPPSKKGRGESADDIITKLSKLINMRSDKLESMVAANTSHIAGLKEKLNSVCEDVNEVKTKVSQVESSLLKESNRIGVLESRITELERYSRRWNLKLHGVPENMDEKNVRKEVIRICQKLLPEHSDRLPDVIDTVHRVGMKKVNSAHGIIIQFSSRTLRAAVWAAAKNSAFLRENGLRFREDLCKADRESRLKLWPLVDEARKAGKIAYFVAGRAFVEKKEIFPSG
ncbi:uncharacterized protein LOC107676675 [Sinocyclocheilus anshuiensis]|uniref:uncharacterized protein LOC107676675 n=1 Tax=Sinocyclocheilus anshuiensis TaxID=1608454 RepID=UPI0007BA62D6|nr:PREDICTED: uncharacterized protein LOC107676675 [Sinocyclocheilus anshuiensis]